MTNENRYKGTQFDSRSDPAAIAFRTIQRVIRLSEQVPRPAIRVDLEKEMDKLRRESGDKKVIE